MNKLSKTDNDFFYSVFRKLIQYVNLRFHLDDTVNLQLDEKIDPRICKLAANKVWEQTSMIDDHIRFNKIEDKSERNLLISWKRCVLGAFYIERHLKSGSIFISMDDKVYKVIGLTISLEESFYFNFKPTLLKTVLLPFNDVIITDGLYEVYPIMPGPNIKSSLRETYNEAKRNNQIISTLSLFSK